MELRRFAAMLVFVVALAQVSSLAQEHSPQHHHYKLVDLGTFGGPNSFLFGFTRPISRQGLVTGCADTAQFDPNLATHNPYFGGDPYIQRSYLWMNGVRSRLRVLPGGVSSCTQWINDIGQIVGASENGQIDPLTGLGEIRAVLWNGNGAPRDLGTLGGNGSVAWAINNAGQVAGQALNDIPDDFNFDNAFGMVGGTQTHAFLWEHGVMKDLGTLGGPDSGPYAINERGQVVGLAAINSTPNPDTGLPTVDPFFWDGTRMVDLGSLGGTFGLAVDVNNRGQVVGNSTIANNDASHAFLWPGSDGKMIDLPTLGGSFTVASAISSTGDVTGASFLPGGDDFHAVLWTRGTIVDLGVVAGDLCASGLAINSKRQVVGYSNHDECHTENHSHGFLWEDGTLFDLNQLISNHTNLIVTDARRINDLGEIAANSLTAEGNNHAVILIPCDVQHPNVPGCDYRPLSVEVAQHASSGTQRPTRPVRHAPRSRLMEGTRN